MILDELKQYACDCISGKIISGRKHIWACERLLRDIDRIGQPDFPYVWDEDQAENIVEWFALLRHSKGVLAKQPIILTPWQRFRICQLYGWVHKNTGYRRFKKYFTEVARKNAKSQEEAGIALYEAAVTSTKNGEVYEIYTAGTKRDQSKIVFGEAGLMLQGSPLRMKFKVTRDCIKHLKSNSTIKPLSKDDGKSGDGTNPALLVLDEYHQHKTTEFYDLGIGSNTKEPLLMIITTAGMDLTYPCYVTEYQYCSKVLDPNTDVENDEYTFSQDNVMHFKTWCTLNGIMGKPVRQILQDSISGAVESQKYLNQLYASGLTAKAALQYTGDLDKPKRMALQKEYNALLSGAKNAGKVVAVPVGMTLQPLNVTLADAQYAEIKKYTALQIAAAFGIKPNQLNDYDKSSYSNSESQQLAFLVDTMSYRLSQYEQEINYKCLSDTEKKEGYYFKFNEKAILRTDSKTQKEVITGYVQNGIYTINEGRDLLDLPFVDGGDVNMVNGTYQPITHIGAAYGINTQGGEGDGD